MAIKLSLSSLPSLPETVARPAYDRASLSPGILHVGVGNFHRAHQAVYLDSLFARGQDHDWGILGAGIMPGDARMHAALAEQDWLSTVVEQDVGHMKAHVTGAMCDFLPITADHAPLLTALTDPAIRIVSLTVTEGGYFLDPATGAFDPDHPAIKADAAHPESPKTVFGLIAHGLRTRRDTGVAPFTVMSCDNVPHNGRVTREAVAGLARLSDPALAAWIEGNVAFPNGMVDRITPATSDRERAFVKDNLGVEDAWPVFCEPFKQWVLEDDFPQGRPALEEVGVQFVTDVTPYETMKIRILNGGHAVIAYAAGLMDIEFVHEAMANPLIDAFFARVESEEILPVVPPVPDTSLEDYMALIRRRFSNPSIGDTIRRLCFDGSNRQPKFIIRTASDALSAGRSAKGLALVSALWCRYCQGVTDGGATIAANDPSWDRLQAKARAAAQSPEAWLGMTDIYGDLGRNPEFSADFAAALERISTRGAEAALRAYVDGSA